MKKLAAGIAVTALGLTLVHTAPVFAHGGHTSPPAHVARRR